MEAQFSQCAAQKRQEAGVLLKLYIRRSTLNEIKRVKEAQKKKERRRRAGCAAREI